jgi:gliding motility-associated-like protein
MLKTKNTFRAKILFLLFALLFVFSSKKSFSAPPPGNDDPCSATVLNAQATCAYSSFTNTQATATNGAPAPTCAAYSGGDIWFQVVVPSTGSLIINSTAGTMTDGGMAAYTGNCNALTQIGCNDDSNGLMPSLTLNSLTPGASVWIRFWGYAAATGSFNICVVNPPPPPPPGAGAACGSAVPFCMPIPPGYVLPNSTNVASLGSGGVYGCLFSTPNPFWYFLQVQTSGNLVININQTSAGGAAIDVDYVCWGPFTSQAAGCSGISANNIVSCSYSASAAEVCTINNAVAGQFYLLLVTNFSNQAGSISFANGTGSTGTTNCNILCNMTALTATASPCNSTTNTYSVSGQISFTFPPATGVLTVSSSCGGSINVPQPWISPLTYNLPNLNPTSGPCTITAAFSADVTCMLTRNYTSPNPCNTCLVQAGNAGPFCVGSPINLTATTPTTAVTYAWTGPNSFSSNQQNPTIASATAANAGTYTLTATVISSGIPCVSTTNVIVTTPPIANFSYFNANVCQSAGSQFPVYGTGATAGTFSATPTGLSLNSATGQITVSSSTAGSYTITNSFPANGGCPAVSSSAIIHINQLPVATFNYANSPYCSNSTNPSPTFVGTGVAGTFSSVPAGLVFVSNGTGQINIASSAPGTYTVSNTIPAGSGCPAVVATSTVSITAMPVANFSYLASPYCQTAANPSPTFNGGGVAGVFSSTAGLVINSANGIIDLASSLVGSYTITNTIASLNGCPAVIYNSPITISPLPLADFTYVGGPFCQSSTNPLPTFASNAVGGTFSATASLSLNNASGEISLASSLPGNYTVSNTVSANNGCPSVVASTTVSVSSAPLASFVYTSSPYCQTAANPSPSFTGGSVPGVFSASAGLIVNTTTGEVDLANSSPGTYTVTNTVGALNGCPAVSFSSPITISPLPIADFSYLASPFCQSGTNPLPTFGAAAIGGTFSASALLNIDNVSGEINLSSSLPGNYTVSNTISAANGCPSVVATSTVSITALPLASFVYPSSPYCQTATNPSPTFTTGSIAGTFSATTGLIVNTTTGEVDLANSPSGTYTVANTIAASNGCPSVDFSSSITITPLPIADFEYQGSPYCQSGTNPLPIFLNGGSAGGFSSSAGLALNSISGEINLASSQGGNYVVNNTINAAFGCPVVVFSYTISINSSPLPNFSYSATNYCQQDAITPSPIFGLGALAGVFSSNAGLTMNALGNIDLLNTLPGTYTVTNTIAATAACPQLNFDIIVNVFANPIVLPSNNSPVCEGTTLDVTSNAIANATYAWLGPNGFISANSNDNVSLAALANMSGTYTLTITENGCSSVATTDVIVNNIPSANLTGGGTVCQGNIVPAIHINLSGTGPWNIGFTDGILNYSIITTLPQHSISNPPIGQYSLTSVVDANCLGTINGTAISMIHPKPIAKAGVDIYQSCAPLCVNFTDSSSVQAPDVISSWLWNYGGTTSTIQNPQNCFPSGIYNVSLVVTTNNGCADTVSYPAMLQSYQMPSAVISAPTETSILNPIVYFTSYSTGATNWLWTFGDSLASTTDNQSTNENTNHTYSASGTYCVDLAVSNNFGCADTTTACIKIVPSFAFYVPSSFTPNGDGTNDVFMGGGTNIADFEMTIFDRWGNKIFASNSEHDGWDGKFGGSLVQQDIYIYKIKIRDSQSMLHEYLGNITLLR